MPNPETKKNQLPHLYSLRYGKSGAGFDLRSLMLRLLGWLQRKRVVLLKNDPRLCGAILAASDRKGAFIEHLFAIPSWNPVYSIESMDGEVWQQLSRDFKTLLTKIAWRQRLPLLIEKASERFAADFSTRQESARVVGAEDLSRFSLRVLYELLFGEEIKGEDESLFYRASIEWRKEIAIKGKADPRVKVLFFETLRERLKESRYATGLETYAEDPARFISLFAQPFLLSPQINISDIFVAIFSAFSQDSRLKERSVRAASEADRAYLEGVILEAIRQKHPFPILERELTNDFHSATASISFPKGTQVFILLDQFEGDSEFRPERWMSPHAENPYHAIPFAAGPRMCIGKPVALELLYGMLQTFLLVVPFECMKPELGHLYSGRNNDGKETAAETFHQLKVFAGAIQRSFTYGRKRTIRIADAKAPSGPAQCPFSRMTEAVGPSVGPSKTGEVESIKAPYPF